MKETQPYNENSFPWHMVDSKWNAVARDSDYTSWTLYEEKPGYNGTDNQESAGADSRSPGD